MPPPPLVVVHERIAHWHRQLRPRVLAWDESVRWVESRSVEETLAAIRGVASPVVVVDVAADVVGSLEVVARVNESAPDALVMVMDRLNHAGLADVAREAGAGHVFSGVVRGTEVFEMLVRWLLVARKATAVAGWSQPVAPTPEPWEDPDAFARQWLARTRWARR